MAQGFFQNLGQGFLAVPKALGFAPWLNERQHFGNEYSSGFDGLNQQVMQDVKAEETRARDQRDALLNHYQQREESLRQLLDQQVPIANQAIDAQMGRLLEEAGYQGNMGRQKVGAAMADRGLSRSTFNANQLGEVDLAEQQQKAGIRGEAAQAKAKVQEAADAPIRQIRDRREAIKLANTMDELNEAENLSFDLEMQMIRDTFQGQMFERGIKDSQTKQGIGFLGNMAGAATKIFSGGLF